MLKLQHENKMERRRHIVCGTVQGVGFRPFVYRLAHEEGLNGWVRNTPQGVEIEVEGKIVLLNRFHKRLEMEKPVNAVIDAIQAEVIPFRNAATFEIIQSTDTQNITASILPDLDVCAECLSEMNNPADRRYRYPFINCTHCGPRYTIMTRLPYDRRSTTMSGFEMCASCRAEYEYPLNRRFHAQPIACPECGPHIELWDSRGNTLAQRDDALYQAASAIRSGKVLALKGLGGFHLIVDAGNVETVKALRVRKHRPTKPFALMYPTMEMVRSDCIVSEAEAALLQSPQAPIVLLKKKNGQTYEGIAPGNPYLGVMLSYTPLHALLMQELGFPVIATSGNRVSDPICMDEYEALERLEGIADLFLVHNRPVARRAEDSIIRIMAGEATVLRRARGYAPLPIPLPHKTNVPIMATGGHLKNTVAFAVEDKLILSPHIGDLDTPEAMAAHELVMADLSAIYQSKPQYIACDAHPGYASTKTAHDSNLPVIAVQHHYAHALSCMADNGLKAPCLAVAWDGTGYGDDGTIWGGEFLKITETGYERIAHFLPFPLPGGELAAKEPRRAAFGLLDILGQEAIGFSSDESNTLRNMIKKRINSPLTSSTGRLFDAVAALTGLCAINSFEGEAAMAMEFAAEVTEDSYDFEISNGIIDWRPMLNTILNEIKYTGNASCIASKFHNTLTDIITAVAKLSGENRIILTGGCFQNRLLLESGVKKLKSGGFGVFWHHRIPPNDGGIAVGQIIAAIRNK